MEIKCSDLGIANCSYTARGETPGEAVEAMVKHLRQEHHLDMPDAEDILDASSAKDRADLDAVADFIPVSCWAMMRISPRQMGRTWSSAVCARS